MNRIGVIGTNDNIKVFSMCGIDAFLVKDKSEATKIIDKLANQKFAIIFVTESIVKQIPDTILKYKYKLTPTITPIPDLLPAQGPSFASESLAIDVKKATGSDISINYTED